MFRLGVPGEGRHILEVRMHRKMRARADHARDHVGRAARLCGLDAIGEIAHQRFKFLVGARPRFRAHHGAHNA